MRSGLYMGQECGPLGLIARGGRMLTGDLSTPLGESRCSMDALAGPGWEGWR